MTQKNSDQFFYRIEHPETNLGPYIHQGFEVAMNTWATQLHTCDSVHPSPSFDNIDKQLTPDHTFGFASMYQLERWFKKAELSNLASLGYKIVKIPKYLCEDVLYGKKQVAFKKVKPIHIYY